MADPYNNNPFSTDNGERELRSEYAANNALRDTLRGIAQSADYLEALDYDPWKELKND